MEALLKQLYTAVLEGERLSAKKSVKAALNLKIDPQIILSIMTSAMHEVGKRFEEGEYFVPEMLIAARAMQAGMELLKPHLLGVETQTAGLVVIGTVKGDLHDVGKNLVALMLEGAGFEVIDLGVDVSAEQFVRAVREHHPRIVAVSALLTLHARSSWPWICCPEKTFPAGKPGVLNFIRGRRAIRCKYPGSGLRWSVQHTAPGP